MKFWPFFRPWKTIWFRKTEFTSNIFSFQVVLFWLKLKINEHVRWFKCQCCPILITEVMRWLYRGQNLTIIYFSQLNFNIQLLCNKIFDLWQFFLMEYQSERSSYDFKSLWIIWMQIVAIRAILPQRKNNFSKIFGLGCTTLSHKKAYKISCVKGRWLKFWYVIVKCCL